MANLKLFFFGTPRITLDGTLVNLPRRKFVALLAYLAVTQQQHHRDPLATLLWPESSQSVACGALRGELHALTTASRS